MLFAVHNKSRSVIFSVESESVEDAALKALRKSAKTRVNCVRTTGEPGKSGWFQGYVSRRDQTAQSSHGEPLHVG
jgi:hypothetical protein